MWVSCCPGAAAAAACPHHVLATAPRWARPSHVSSLFLRFFFLCVHTLLGLQGAAFTAAADMKGDHDAGCSAPAGALGGDITAKPLQRVVLIRTKLEPTFVEPRRSGSEKVRNSGCSAPLPVLALRAAMTSDPGGRYQAWKRDGTVEGRRELPDVRR